MQENKIHCNIGFQENVIYCCIKCGSWLIHPNKKKTYCLDCRNGLDGKTATIYEAIYTAQHPKSYYQNLSIERYGTSDYWHEIFVEIELSKQPQFSPEKYKLYLQRQTERNERKNEIISMPKQPRNDNNNSPKCPICGSTNLEKISDLKRATHWLAFGLFSQTAKSQFRCKKCDYKF